MKATIIHIMESWPLQLALQSPTGSEHAALAENARILRGCVIVGPGELRPGQSVEVIFRTTKGEITELRILD
jgi:hypothetical protein